MEAYVVFFLMCMLPVGIHTIADLKCSPVLTQDMAANITTNSVILQEQSCCTDFSPLPNCTQDKCELWLVSAVDTGVTNFDNDSDNPMILSLSPYPNAFTGNTAKNYYLTRIQSNFHCPAPSTGNYFRVGADGKCLTDNCNGVLPEGSTARFKYLILNPANNKIHAASSWSQSITLYTSKDPSTIGDGFAGRSGAMVVITSILAVAAAVLLLFLLIILALCCCGSKGKAPGSVMGSFRIPRYDTHQLKDPAPYDNFAFEKERKYTSADTLPKSSATTAVNPASQDVIKMQKI
ncbi:hypothetical protein NFI96_033537 [Prochilodus magdalenae]|nr:hypothetical protein NFI96_033537 [Prochilodus magdalenae]